MTLKRKGDDAEEMTSRERKKLKVAGARTIAVQPIVSASGSGTVQSSGNALAGPSSTTVRFDSMQGLPASIDVERFTEARAYEIDAMQKAIKTAGESVTHRVWQTLPRHLRRRAASHDVRRVPLRLRDKARAEMVPVTRRILKRGRSKQGKTKQVSRTESLLKRQRDKTWLETHIWHAKRMKMENMWGYRLAITPTEKSFRPSHRASVHGSILHDSSYHSLIELKGPENILRNVFDLCCDPQCTGMKRSMSGSRVLETDLYKTGSYPFDLIAPVTIMWRPLPVGSAPTNASSAESSSKRRRKGKNNVPAATAPQSSTRAVWVRSHPAVFDDVFGSLQQSASLVLEAEKQRHEDVYAEVEIADRRGSVNAFEIMGPKASQVIKGALSPVGDDDRQEFKKFWSSLTDLQTTASLPRGIIIGMKVLDPRLKFPPKNAKPRTNDQHVVTPAMTFPAAILAQSEIWDEEKRSALKKPTYKKKDLDTRRSKNLVPGTPLNPIRQDDRIPLLLIQRSFESPSSTHGIHGWTLVFPAGWGMPFLPSLIHTGTRVGGQRERSSQAFEAGTACFPRDFPCTEFYEKHWDERAIKEKAKWDRTPPAKRANHKKLGTRSPWRADWEVVLGLPMAPDIDENLVPAQRGPQDAMEVDIAPTVRPWLLRGPEVPTILAKVTQMFNHGAGLLAEVNRLRTKRGMDVLDASHRPEDLLKGALVMVRAKMVSRGAPNDLANIYRINDVEAKKIIKEKGKTREGADVNQPPEAPPPHASIIGYVTSGNMSLSRGEGFAIGAVPVSVLLELQQQSQRNGESRPLVKIRDRAGMICRAAYLELLDS
ncbi:ribonucleases P/MRP protein subunit POP1-domain-containing protein [Suillus clintonianus]|uniref:ribonucleases P/MRP protein subunit POP1-domain-containing protein n=1 Tax=Suillus clintonianus TaxID=1904413 RepID=UPI001B8842BB|nr:ribonucleases P/MRP protein subunit POP1-domain-containing protein [Suillus clintonianus]KAG2145816.1 ribonucleases P/MRP protein subunit POP1-domain-containing protein [Suillus clintonianus]